MQRIHLFDRAVDLRERLFHLETGEVGAPGVKGSRVHFQRMNHADLSAGFRQFFQSARGIGEQAVRVAAEGAQEGAGAVIDAPHEIAGEGAEQRVVFIQLAPTGDRPAALADEGHFEPCGLAFDGFAEEFGEGFDFGLDVFRSIRRQGLP
jgi:hypothetical protein